MDRIARRTIAICLLIYVNFINAIDVIDGKIKISVGTTSACGDTMVFINGQLAETYDLYKEFLDIEFVPWGKTMRNDDDSLTCQFGESDCWANRVHRCALDLLKDNPEAQMLYMRCEFTTPYPALRERSYRCAEMQRISLVDLDYCVTTTGDSLDRVAEEAAKEIMEAVWFVPSVHFNGVIDVNNHNQAQTRLASMICFALAEDPSTGVTECQI